MTQERKDADGELERQCTQCGEWWPADKEFFYPNGKHGLHTQCKACYLERKKRKYHQEKELTVG